MMLSFKQLHDEVTRLVDAIRNGGGGGGSTVTVTQKRTTGDNIAAITVNGNVTELYAPNDAKDIAFDNDKEGVFSNDNVQDVLDEVGYTLTDHDTRITQNTSDISDLNDTLTQLNIDLSELKKGKINFIDYGLNTNGVNISFYGAAILVIHHQGVLGCAVYIINSTPNTFQYTEIMQTLTAFRVTISAVDTPNCKFKATWPTAAYKTCLIPLTNYGEV